jgi:hypothetical protein
MGGEELGGAIGGEALPPPPPDAGLPPPPGEEAGAALTTGFNPGENILDHQDPNAQVVAPNELTKVNTGKKKKKLFPDLMKHAFGTEKTAMDPKRNYSELMRATRIPFGENTEEKVFDKNVVQLKKFARDLEGVDVLRSFRNKKIKKVLL